MKVNNYNIHNAVYDDVIITANDIFVCALGNELRSLYMLKKISKKLPLSNIIVFCFPNIINKEVRDYLSKHSFSTINTTYKNYSLAIETIKNRYQSSAKPCNIHVDFSAMPRDWYSRMPMVISPLLSPEENLFFWYVEATGYQSIPNAGISSFNYFFGSPTIRPDNKRTHVLALGYDSIRTQAAISMLDPDSYITCMAYDYENKKIKDMVLKVNEDIISHSTLFLSLPIHDFEFMLSKLCEITADSLTDGDVILVPDGPKPLIFAMSLVPSIIGKKGITCLHISRNLEHEVLNESNNVYASDKIVGFSLTE